MNNKNYPTDSSLKRDDAFYCQVKQELFYGYNESYTLAHTNTLLPLLKEHNPHLFSKANIQLRKTFPPRIIHQMEFNNNTLEEKDKSNAFLAYSPDGFWYFTLRYSAEQIIKGKKRITTISALAYNYLFFRNWHLERINKVMLYTFILAVNEHCSFNQEGKHKSPLSQEICNQITCRVWERYINKEAKPKFKIRKSIYSYELKDKIKWGEYPQTNLTSNLSIQVSSEDQYEPEPNKRLLSGIMREINLVKHKYGLFEKKEKRKALFFSLLRDIPANIKFDSQKEMAQFISSANDNIKIKSTQNLISEIKKENPLLITSFLTSKSPYPIMYDTNANIEAMRFRMDNDSVFTPHCSKSVFTLPMTKQENVKSSNQKRTEKVKSKLRSAFETGISKKGLAKKSGVDKNTVKKYWEEIKSNHENELQNISSVNCADTINQIQTFEEPNIEYLLNNIIDESSGLPANIPQPIPEEVSVD